MGDCFGKRVSVLSCGTASPGSEYQCMCPPGRLEGGWEIETGREKAPAKHVVELYL